MTIDASVTKLKLNALHTVIRNQEQNAVQMKKSFLLRLLRRKIDSFTFFILYLQMFL